METRTYTVYKFKELPKESQQKAIDKYRENQCVDNWWDFTYQNAKDIGLQINGFDLDRGSYVKGEWITSPYEAIKLIKENHGKKCATYKTAVFYEKKFKALGKDQDGNRIEDENLEDDFRNTLLEDYRTLLQEEYDWLMSEQCIKETIELNDYNFTIDGKKD